MSWIHSSKVIVLGVLLAVSLATVGTAVALSVDGQSPAPAEVGETVTVEATVEEPFRDAPPQWDLQGETDLENATWTVHVSAQGDPVTTQDYQEQSFSHHLDSQNGSTMVEVEVSGTVPEMQTFDYRELSAENYTAIALMRGTNELETLTGHRYTEQSREARTAIDEAVEAQGGTNDKIDQAISAYDNENFGNAIDLAEEAEGGAQSSQLLMIGAGVIVVLALVGGGVYYWRQRSQSEYKLQ